jgi:hypothetical protein
MNITDAIADGLIIASTNNPNSLLDHEIPTLEALNIKLASVPKSHTTATWATVKSTNYKMPYLFAESKCSTTIEFNDTDTTFYQYTQIHSIEEPSIPSDIYVASTSASNRIFTLIDEKNAITIPFGTSVALVYCMGSVWNSSVGADFPQWENIERYSSMCSESSIKLPIRYYNALEKALDNPDTAYNTYSITLPHICNSYRYITLDPDTSRSLDLEAQASVFASQLCEHFYGWDFSRPDSSSSIVVSTNNKSQLEEAFKSTSQVFILNKRVESSLEIYSKSMHLGINGFYSNTFSFNSSNYILDIGMPSEIT